MQLDIASYTYDEECAASYSQYFGHVKTVHRHQLFQDTNILELQLAQRFLTADIAIAN